MSERIDSESSLNPGVQLLRGLLVLAAVMVLVGGCVIAGLLWAQGQPSNDTIALALASALAGLFFAAMLVATAGIVGMLSTLRNRVAMQTADDVRPALERLEQSLRMLNNLQNRNDAARGAAEGSQALANGSARPVQLLEQLRDLTLMDEAQRKGYAQHFWARRKQSHLEAIERDVLVGDWTAAFARLEELQVVLPGDTQVSEMQERVESEQASRLEEDVRVARGRLKIMMASAMWPQAEELAASLQSKYAGKAEADRLVEDVRRERENWERENTEKLFRDITAANERHQWRQAVLAVEEFIRRYPLDDRAEALRLDLPTLQENSAAHERKQQEEHFKDLLKRQRYDEAIGVARAVIAKYPQSPTATEMSKLLPRIEEMAKAEAERVASQGASVAVPAGA